MIDGAGDHQSLTDSERDGRGVITSLTAVSARSAYDDADQKLQTGTIMVVAGGVAAAGGLLWWILAPRSEASGTEPATGLLLQPAGLLIRGRF